LITAALRFIAFSPPMDPDSRGHSPFFHSPPRRGFFCFTSFDFLANPELSRNTRLLGRTCAESPRPPRKRCHCPNYPGGPRPLSNHFIPLFSNAFVACLLCCQIFFLSLIGPPFSYGCPTFALLRPSPFLFFFEFDFRRTPV